MAVLWCAHGRGVLHPDIKPVNHLFDEHGAQVAAYGLAWAGAESGSCACLEVWPRLPRRLPDGQWPRVTVIAQPSVFGHQAPTVFDRGRVDESVGWVSPGNDVGRAAAVAAMAGVVVPTVRTARARSSSHDRTVIDTTIRSARRVSRAAPWWSRQVPGGSGREQLLVDGVPATRERVSNRCLTPRAGSRIRPRGRWLARAGACSRPCRRRSDRGTRR